MTEHDPKNRLIPGETEQPKEFIIRELRLAGLISSFNNINTGGYSNKITSEVERGNSTIEQLATKVGSDVYAFQTYRRIEGMVMIRGEAIPVSSGNIADPTGVTGTIYIDGQVRSSNDIRRYEAKKDESDPDLTFFGRKISDHMEENGWRYVIVTRTGEVKPYMTNDKNISLPKKGQSKL